VKRPIQNTQVIQGSSAGEIQKLLKENKFGAGIIFRVIITPTSCGHSGRRGLRLIARC
jgi:hypothetical protein